MAKQWRASLSVAATILRVTWLRPARCPISLKYVGVARSGVFDDTDHEYLLAQIEASNRDIVSVMVENITKAELKLGGRWIESDQDLQLSQIRVGWARNKELLSPAGTEAIRLRLNYQPETWRHRMRALIGPEGIKRLAKAPWLAKHSWPDQYHRFSNPPK